jgi:hypothetical protein
MFRNEDCSKLQQLAVSIYDLPPLNLAVYISYDSEDKLGLCEISGSHGDEYVDDILLGCRAV